MTNPFALIIEDDENLGIIFAKSLQSANYATEIVKDGQIAMDRLAEISPDVIVLDIHLPQVQGTEILNHIRATPIWLIFVSLLQL